VKPFSVIGAVMPNPKGAVSKVIVFARTLDAKLLATTITATAE